MPYAHHHGVRIHSQVEGAGPPLVLQHGLTNSLERWDHFGYVEGGQVLVDSGAGDEAERTP